MVMDQPLDFKLYALEKIRCYIANIRRCRDVADAQMRAQLAMSYVSVLLAGKVIDACESEAAHRAIEQTLAGVQAKALL